MMVHLFWSHTGLAALLESGFEETSHPPYSHELTPTDYHLFPNLKKHLHGQRFSTVDEFKYMIEEWLKEQSELSVLQTSKNARLL